MKLHQGWGWFIYFSMQHQIEPFWSTFLRTELQQNTAGTKCKSFYVTSGLVNVKFGMLVLLIL